ncbi:MAG: glycerophosphoryl diester phosphodiesterase [Chthoniobacter sp.]|jgi:glycerophosphoryl diester phosphodiesterase|nr:glycerophosphoryl diester phosphodiesterase [Chthoniobacter sp.]
MPALPHALGALWLLTLPLSATEIVAHRGASQDAPENTVASFKLAWGQKADAGELDIHLTKDGRIVVIHDKTTKRTAGVDRNVVEQTLAEVRALDAGSWKGAQWKGEKIPTLAEALATVPEGKQMFIEIKGGDAEVLPELGRVLKDWNSKQLVIIGSKYATMKEAKERFPELTVYWIESPKKESQGLLPPIDGLIARAKAAKLDGLDVDYRFAIDQTFVSHVKEAGLKLYVWTVNDAAVARKLAALGIDGITTNRPGWLRDQLAAPRPPER